MKKFIFSLFALALVVMAFFLVGVDDVSNADEKQKEVNEGAESIKESPKEIEKTSAFPPNSKIDCDIETKRENQPFECNFILIYHAHEDIVELLENKETDVQETLENVKLYLSKVRYDDGDLKDAIDLTNQSLKEQINRNDPILKDIHGILHDLYTFLNPKGESPKDNL